MKAANPVHAAGGDHPARPDGRTARWQQHRLDRRAEFVDAALRALAAHGPEASMADIAAEAGAAKPKLYRHFADKAALFCAVGERIAGILRQRLATALDPTLPVERLTREGLDAYLGLVDDYPDAFRFLLTSGFIDRNRTPDPMLAEGRRIAGALAALLAHLLRILDLDTDTAEPGGAVLAGALGGATIWWLDTDRAIDKQALIDYLAIMVWGAADAMLRGAGVVIDPTRPIGPGNPDSSPDS
ncbi:MAG TPA: TetR/AcrR family transcriptional regulator [Pseudonocardiaceae bacterium]|nr:TetR/AcrR family transcriptional regulator [Pseudonocardiaceae bacterium]